MHNKCNKMAEFAPCCSLPSLTHSQPREFCEIKSKKLHLVTHFASFLIPI